MAAVEVELCSCEKDQRGGGVVWLGWLPCGLPAGPGPGPGPDRMNNAVSDLKGFFKLTQICNDRKDALTNSINFK
jgi:hypothetical protein